MGPSPAGAVVRDLGATSESAQQRGGAAVDAWIARVSSPTIAVVATAIIVITAVAASAAFIGADARWLAAVGNVIVKRHAIPVGVPFAAASTTHWANAIVLAELIFHGIEAALGDRGLMIAQVVAVVLAMTVLARDALRDKATGPGTAAALAIAALGALPSLAIVRVQLFSVALFPLLVALLRSEARRPSRRIWLVTPLLAVWANLHGVVLVGLGITFLYLALARFPDEPRTALAVGAAAILSVFATPAGWRTASYYDALLTNAAAARGQGMWGPLSLTSVVDIPLVLAALALGSFAFRRKLVRPPAWERIALIALVAMTATAVRSGIWLLFLLVGPAARSIQPKRTWRVVLPGIATVALAVLVLSIIRGPLPSGASPALIDRAIALAHGTPILAEDLLAEQIALAGGRVWAGNPIEAFSHADQATYLDWLAGKPSGTRAIQSGIGVVLTERRSAAQKLMARMAGFALLTSDQHADIYVRNRPLSSTNL